MVWTCVEEEHAGRRMLRLELQADSQEAWRKTKAEIYGCAVREHATLKFTRMGSDGAK